MYATVAKYNKSTAEYEIVTAADDIQINKLNVANNVAITALNTAGDAEIDLIRADANNHVVLGDSDKVLKCGGMTFDMNAKPLTNLPAPTAASDATRKDYVDARGGLHAMSDLYNNGTSGTLNWNNGISQRVQLGTAGALALTFQNGIAGRAYVVKFEHAAAGSKTVNWPSDILWSGASPDVSTSNGYTDIVTLFYDGTNYYANSVMGYVE